MSESQDNPFALPEESEGSPEGSPEQLQGSTEREPAYIERLLVFLASLIAVAFAFFSTCVGTGVILIGKNLGNPKAPSGEILSFIAVVVGLFAAVVTAIAMRNASTRVPVLSLLVLLLLYIFVKIIG